MALAVIRGQAPHECSSSPQKQAGITGLSDRMAVLLGFYSVFFFKFSFRKDLVPCACTGGVVGAQSAAGALASSSGSAVSLAVSPRTSLGALWEIGELLLCPRVSPDLADLQKLCCRDAQLCQKSLRCSSEPPLSRRSSVCFPLPGRTGSRSRACLLSWGGPTLELHSVRCVTRGTGGDTRGPRCALGWQGPLKAT